jgi:K+ transporter
MTSSADAVSTPAAAEAPARSPDGGALGVVFGDIGTSPIYAFRPVVPRPRKSYSGFFPSSFGR